ncbi:alpha/beta fold hydrolase [Nonomuraea sp. NPDC050404]|uniref:alpha/beta fold hydrolase n=1 Tax=Nonomuraea sp. NPDC050404 TaxID=3155783 RepID=UPI003406F16F
MTTPTAGRLRVPGATLHYEVRGSGPLLLLIPGGTGGAASFDGIADDLAADHTVVSYDPRGLSRSPLDDPQARQEVAQHADDAFRLLELVAPGASARVAGCSSGAIVALHLLTAHPERISLVVAHEPPVVEVLPDAAGHRAMLARVQDTFHREGLMPAAAIFAAALTRPATSSPDTTTPPGPATPPGSSAPPATTTSPGTATPPDTATSPDTATPPDTATSPDTAAPPGSSTPPGTTASAVVAAEAELPPEAAARVQRTMADMPYFLGRIVPSFMAYVPDLDRLQALSDRLVLAAGTDSRGELPYRPAAFMAERFGTELVHFPGGHTGLSTHPAEFGKLLSAKLSERVM